MEQSVLRFLERCSERDLDVENEATLVKRLLYFQF